MKELTFDKWSDFQGFILDDRQLFPVYWRGQRDPKWPLASSFERQVLNWAGGWKSGASKIFPYDGRYDLNGKKIWGPQLIQDSSKVYLDRFRQAASGLRGLHPPYLNDPELWALGRHHGLITPLLDWTDTPYFAAFWALIDMFQFKLQRSPSGTITFDNSKVAVFRLFHNKHLEGDGLGVFRPEIDELHRLQMQRGLFTWLKSEEYFELQGFLDNTGRGNLLTKILLTDQVLKDGLLDLEAHGIDHRTMFPDLSGAALKANSQYAWV